MLSWFPDGEKVFDFSQNLTDGGSYGSYSVPVVMIHRLTLLLLAPDCELDNGKPACVGLERYEVELSKQVMGLPTLLKSAAPV